MMLRSRDAIAGVQPRQNKLDAGCTHRRALARVDLEGLLPGLRDPFEPLGILARGKQIADFDFHPFAEYLDDLLQAVLIDILGEYNSYGLGLDRFKNLALRHLLAAHHVELQLTQRRSIEMTEVAD